MSQQRLARVQLVNWGTFNGYWAFNVPRQGLLLTGPSGAGKSSILDALAAILVRPVRLRFNAAAQGTDTGDRERSVITYVRGAYKRETDETTGEVCTAFLRMGTTWSAIALTFDDGRGELTTLIRGFHLRQGVNDSSGLATVYALAPEAVELMDLKEYFANGIDSRRIRNALVHWDVYGEKAYTGFAAKFCRRLGIASEQAQVLLHKTQSAKNLTNLDGLFRNFMLDEPDTFDLAQQTVAQFDELSQAHATVLDARRQVQALTPLRDLDARWQTTQTDLARLAAQEAHLDTWLKQQELAAARQALVARQADRRRFELEYDRAEQQYERAEGVRRAAQRAVDGAGGGQLDVLTHERQLLQQELEDRQARRAELGADAQRVGGELPTSAAESVEFAAALESLIDRLAEQRKASKETVYDAANRHAAVKQQLQQVTEELAALRDHRSNLDARLLALRQLLCQALQVPVARLPFVGELLQVRTDQAEWTGAIERVLGSFARTLVVPEAHYLAAAEFIDARPLGVRLVYERVRADAEAASPIPAGDDRLAGKLEVKAGDYAGWLTGRLAARYDYACVEHPRDFAAHERAVTRNGQVKHSRSRHEKDDRFAVNDRTRWVLGFTTEAKEAELRRLLAHWQTQVNEAMNARDAAQRSTDQINDRQVSAERLASLSWPQIDVADSQSRLDANADEMAQLRNEHADLPQLAAALESAIRALTDCDRSRLRLRQRLAAAETAVEESAQLIGRLESALAMATPVPDEVAEQIGCAVAGLGASAESVERGLRTTLAAQRDRLNQATRKISNEIVRQMGNYRAVWAAAATDWGQDVDYLPEYLERLDLLEADRLPEFEKRFFTLLRQQTNNNIAMLSQQVRRARRQIRSRVDEVNTSLRLTEFTPGGHLRIDVQDRALPEVDEFLSTLNQITAGSLDDVWASDDPADRAQAEQRFEVMRALLRRLGSSDPADRAWRDKCLDTRQHVRFQAQVIDAQSRQLDVFVGSGGRSGGERQKLVTFCLAAALRFQLAPAGEAEPRFALVSIDEAFDKADQAFTRAGLEVFTQFGFQLLLATPMKMLQTIEDFVGGVVMVTSEPGNGSVLRELAFEEDPPAQPATPEPADFQSTLV